MKDKIITIIVSIVIAFIFVLTLLLIIGFIMPKSETPEELCQKNYGKEFHFVNGGSGANLCATKEGKIRYFELIKK